MMKMRVAARKGGDGGGMTTSSSSESTSTSTWSTPLSDSMESPPDGKKVHHKCPKTPLRGKKISLVRLLGGVATILSLHVLGNTVKGKSMPRPTKGSQPTPSVDDLVRIYQNCSMVLASSSSSSSSSPRPPPRSQPEWRKPLWVPSFLASGSASPSRKGDIVKELIDALTGLSGGTKNYHMSMRKGQLKRCYGVSETAACSMGHPFVPVQPEQQTENFQPWVILVVRNFLTAFPAGHTDKHLAYHKGQGQPPEENWRQVRDEYLEPTMGTWREMIRYWTKGGAGPYYQVGLILPYEWLLDPIRGPRLVQELADLYRKVGFDIVVPTTASTPTPTTVVDEMSCIWYQMASKEWKRQNELISDYLPGYTVTQRDFMIRQLDEAWQEHQGDPVLKILLQEYKDQILKETRMDVPATATATPAATSSSSTTTTTTT